jgi:membrane fusion protein, multidrug efflux system
MNGTRSWMAVTALLLLGLASCGSPTPQPSHNAAAIPVRVDTLAGREFTDALSATGIVKAFDDIMLSPEEGGVVKEWLVSRGHYVRKGTVIALLKDEILKAGYDAANAQYQMAELNAEKQQAVFQQQGISEVQYKNFLYGRDAAKANADLMKSRLDHARITSPVDGILDDTFADAGEMAPPGVPIARIVNIDRMKIQAEIPERFSGSVATGMRVSAAFDALPDVIASGTISYASAAVSAANRTLTVEVVVPNPGRKLKPEMIAKLQIIRAAKENAILISQNLPMLVDRDRQVVYIEENGVARERTLTLGARQGNLVEVLTGLAPGDRIVTVGYQKLVDGQPVTVTP